jgi:DNA-binding NarL/FixJ family response regulator
MRKRILIADDHVLILEGLRNMLGAEFEIEGAFANGRALVAAAQSLQPDLVLLDVGMPELNGIEAARILARTVPSVNIVFVTQQLAPSYVQAAFAAGAKAYVAKQSATSELLTAIRMALRGHFYVTPLAGSEAARLTSLNPRQNPAAMFGCKLTPRQREVLQLVAEGKSTKEISSSLHISTKTVEFHRCSLMDELGVRTIAELTRYAVSQGMVNPQP